MKVGFVYSQVFRHGGVQRVVANIVNELSKKHDVYIICNEEIDIEKNYYLINLDRVKVIHREIFSVKKVDRLINKVNRKLLGYASIIFDIKAKKNMLNIINDLQLDCVIGCMMEYNLLLSTLKPKLSCRVIGWENNSYDSYFNTGVQSKLKLKLNKKIVKTLLSKLKLKLNKKMVKILLSKLDYFIVLTENDQKLYLNNLCLNSKVISNPLSFYSDIKSIVTKKQILIVGRLEPTKGTDFLPIIIENVIKENPDWRFKVIGEGILESDFRQEIERRDLNDKVERVKFTNSISEEYINSSLYICTSRFESFGLTVLEAMHCGLPVVTFNTSGPSELIKNHQCGLIVENNDIDSFIEAINSLCQDEQLRRQYSKNAIERAHDFDLGTICERWEYILKS